MCEDAAAKGLACPITFILCVQAPSDISGLWLIDNNKAQF